MKITKRKLLVISAVIAAFTLVAYKFSKQILPLAAACAMMLASLWTPVRSKFCVGEFDEKKTAIVEGVSITVALIRSHSFLGEHRRYLWFDDGECIDFGTDPGGYAHVNVYSLPDKLIIQTFGPDVLIFEKNTREHHMEKRPLTKDETDAFVGKFHYNGHREYSYSTKQQDEKFDPYVLKGG